MTMTVDQLFGELKGRFDAIDQRISDERLKKMISDELTHLQTDEQFVRKMRFGGEADPKLAGTKYARWGLNVEDVEWLYDLMNSTKRMGLPGPSEMLSNTFGALSKAVYLSDAEVRAMDMKAIDDMFPRLPLQWFRGYDRELAARGAWQETHMYRQARGTVEMDTAQSGFGSQIVGAQYVTDLWQAARAESRVFGLLDTFEMLAPTVYLPVEVDIPEMLFVSESASDLVYSTALYALSKTGSQRVQVVAKKFIINQLWSGEMEEDSIIPFVPFLRRQAMFSVAYYSDSFVINGDTQTGASVNINLIDGTPAATKHYLAADGIRKAGLLDNTNNSKDAAGPVTLALLNGVPARMLDLANQVNVDWGHPTDPSDLVHVVDPITGDNIGLLGEVTAWRQYNNKPLINGQIGEVIGRPIVTSVAVPRANATGKVSTTAGNNTKGSVVSFNKRGAKVGWRRRVKIETERLPGSDQTRLFHSLRMGLGRFTPTGASSGIEWADVIYDIT